MIPFRIKSSVAATPISAHISFSDEGPLLETSEFFEICHGNYQPLNFLPYLTLSTQYSTFICICCRCESLGISKMIDERSSSPNLRRTISEPQTGIEPATF